MKNTRGFSLLELIATLSILAILLLIAVPNFRDLLADAKLMNVADRLSSALQYARSEAVSRGEIVKLCGATNGKHCDGHWENQWLVVSAKQVMLRVFEHFPANLKIVWRSSLAHNNFVNFTPEGFTQGQQGTFLLSLKNNKGRFVKIVLLRSGRARINKSW